MQRNKLELFIDQDQLQNGLGYIKDEDSCPIQGLFEYRYSDNAINTSNGQEKEQQAPFESYENQDLIDLIQMQKNRRSQMFKRPRNTTLLDEEVISPSQSLTLSDEKNKTNQDSQKSGSKKQKQSKQYLYSKNYRDKKKQVFKALQEQNRFLKNKIQDLHQRIRELQMQNNKLKESPQETDITIEQLNKAFMKKLCVLGETIEKHNSDDKDEKQKSGKKATRADLEKQYIQRYDQVGLSGTQKKKVLNYHMDEILEGLLRDSQKYFCMLCCKNEDGSFKVQMPKYQRINMAFFQIMEFKESDQPRIQEYLKFLHSAMKQIKRQCSNMYKHFSKVIQSLNRLHFLWTSTHVKNIDWMIKRMKIENWFEYHKYHKIMRELKSQWLSFIKNENQMEDENLDYSKGYKKAKMYQNMNGQ